MSRIVDAARELLRGGTEALPPVDTRLTVSRAPTTGRARGTGPATPRPVEVPSRVEDLRIEVGRRAGATEIVIAQPSFPGNLQGESPGTGYLLRWVTDRGVHEVPARYLGRERIGPTLIGWRLRVSGPVERVQRRAHARVAITVPVDVVLIDDDRDRRGRAPGGGVLRGYTVNLSEGGLLASLEPPSPAVGTEVVARFSVANESFVVGGRVVRLQPLTGPRTNALAVAVAFTSPDLHGDRLRPLLFAHQMNARRVGVL